MKRFATLLLATLSLAACSPVNGSDTPLTDARESRTGGFDVPRVSNVTIDGRVGDWGEAGFRIDLLHRAEQGEDVQPQSGTPIRLGWDKRGLLVRVRHTDDRWVEVAENAWQYDSLELYVADHEDRGQRYQVVIAPGMSESISEPVVNVHDQRSRQPRPLAVEVERQRDGDTAVIEARLPWANLGWDSPQDHRVAFQVMVNDNDVPGSGYGETSHAAWFPELGAAHDPSLMHTLRLTESASPPYDTHVRVVRDWPEPARIEVAAVPDLAGEAVRLIVDGEVRGRAKLTRDAEVPVSTAALPLAAAKGAPARVEVDARVIGEVDAHPGHPFLICTRDQFPALRDRAEREPWKTMAADARERVAKGHEHFEGRFATALQRYIGAAALVYILDEDDRRANARTVRDAIQRLEDVEFDPKKQWAGTVSPMGAAFVATLALDIVHDDLTEQEIAELGSLIEKQIGKIKPRGAWLAARLGTHGTWELYKNPDAGDSADFKRRFINPFHRNYLRQMTPDGVTSVSPNYAFSRLGSADSRPQKTGFAD
ncbi:MAG: sugar-binding protein, partial [Phycisphaeraceae bacterium]